MNYFYFEKKNGLCASAPCKPLRDTHKQDNRSWENI